MYKPLPDPVAGGGRSLEGGGPPGGSTTNFGGGENIENDVRKPQKPLRKSYILYFPPPEIGHGNVKRLENPW